MATFPFALGTWVLLEGWTGGSVQSQTALQMTTAMATVLAAAVAVKLLRAPPSDRPEDLGQPEPNTRLLREIEERRRGEADMGAESARLAAIVEAQREIAGMQLDTGIVLNLVVERIQALTGAEGAVVEFLEDETMVYRAASGTLAAHLGLRLHAGSSLSGLCVSNGEIQSCSDSEVDPRVDREACRRVGARSLVVAPLSYLGQRVGVLKVVSSRAGHFTRDDVHTLELMADLVASTTQHVQTLAENEALLRQRTEAVRALAATEQRFQAFMDHSPVVAYLKDEQGRYQYGNRACASLFGSGVESLRGKTDFDLMPSSVAEVIQDNDRRILAGNAATELEEVIPDQRRQSRHFSVIKFPLRDATGSRFLGGLAFDISERKVVERQISEATELLQEHAALLELTQDSVVVRDLAGRVRFWNRGAEQTYGWSREEAEGQLLQQLLRPRYEQPEHVIQDELQRQGRWEGEVVHQRRNGTTVTVASRWALQRDAAGSPTAVLEINNDITQRRQAAERLAHQQRLLESSNDELRNFAHMASHDMKEPLRIVGSYAQLLALRYRGQLDAKADGFIGYIVDGVQRLQRLIDDLLEYSQVGGASRPGAVADANLALQQALANLRLAMQDVGAQVSFGVLPQVAADSGQLVQVFQNLVANAVKFRGPAVPAIAVDAEREADHWRFAVRDNGVGFEPQYAEQIFTIFERLHGRGEYPGSGIGLAICKKIVEQFGGHIWAESQPGAGATFYFTLPAAEKGRAG